MATRTSYMTPVKKHLHSVVERITGVFLTSAVTISIAWAGWVSFGIINTTVATATQTTKIEDLTSSIHTVQNTLDLIAPRLGVNPNLAKASTTPK